MGHMARADRFLSVPHSVRRFYYPSDVDVMRQMSFLSNRQPQRLPSDPSARRGTLLRAWGI
jgi:hypothetical protein